jgi:hypothetical protein
LNNIPQAIGQEQFAIFCTMQNKVHDGWAAAESEWDKSEPPVLFES